MVGSKISIRLDPDSYDSSRLLVSGLQPHVERRDLGDHFSNIGEVAFAKVISADSWESWAASRSGLPWVIVRRCHHQARHSPSCGRGRWAGRWRWYCSWTAWRGSWRRWRKSSKAAWQHLTCVGRGIRLEIYLRIGGSLLVLCADDVAFSGILPAELAPELQVARPPLEVARILMGKVLTLCCGARSHYIKHTRLPVVRVASIPRTMLLEHPAVLLEYAGVLLPPHGGGFVLHGFTLNSRPTLGISALSWRAPPTAIATMMDELITVTLQDRDLNETLAAELEKCPEISKSCKSQV